MFRFSKIHLLAGILLWKVTVENIGGRYLRVVHLNLVDIQNTVKKVFSVTTCSRPSIEMVAFMYVCISPCSLPWPDRIRLRGRTWPKGVKIYCRRTPRV